VSRIFINNIYTEDFIIYILGIITPRI